MPTHKPSDITRIRTEDTEDNGDLVLYRRYTDGNQNAQLTAAQRRMLYGQKVLPQSDNVLRLILRTAASRLELTGWDVDEPAIETGDTAQTRAKNEQSVGPAQGYLNGLFVRGRIANLQFLTHFGMLRDGNYAVSLSWRGESDGRVIVHREPWWDETAGDGMFVSYDKDDEPEFAVKEWTERKPGTAATLLRRTIWYPDHFERQYKDGASWAMLPSSTDPVTGEPMNDGTIKWEKSPGDPLGIPVIHFPNGSRDDTNYGLSDLAGLLGFQDQLNSMQQDIAAVSKFDAWSLLWIKGKSADGKPLIVAPGRILELEIGADVGRIAAGSIAGISEAHKYKRETLALNTSTPMHQINGGQWPSGEALLRSEMPAVDKATMLANIVGPLWSTVGHRSIEMHNKFASDSIDEDALITAELADPRRLDDLSRSQINESEARVMEIVSRIRDEALIRALPFLTDATVEALIEERKGSVNSDTYVPDPNQPDEQTLANAAAAQAAAVGLVGV